MQKIGIIFKFSAPYSQEQNGIFEQTEKTIVNITRVTIFKENIDDNLWSELLLVMTYIKNNWPIRVV